MLNFLKRKLGITITTGCLAILMIIIPIKNYIHAEIQAVTNGFISIDSEGIFYGYNGIDKTEIKDYNNRSIQLSQLILQNSFGENGAGILSISHLVKNQIVRQNELATDKGILFFEKDSGLEIPYGTRFDMEFGVKSSQINNLIFAMMGISSTKALVDNRGIINLNINYVFFVANKVENSALNYLIDNSGEISIGLDAIGVSIIGYNLLNGGSFGSSLFGNFNYPTIALYGRFIAIYGNIINSADRYATLFSRYRATIIGSANTETSIISGNELKGKEKSLLFGNFRDSTLVIYGMRVAVERNIIISTNKIAHLFFNKKGKMTIGAIDTEALGISYNKLESKGDAALSYNYSGGSAIILYGRSIVVEGNILNSTDSYTFLFYNRDGTRTVIGSADTERSIFNNNDLRSESTASLFFNFVRSTMIVYGKFVTVDGNTINSNGHVYFFYNYGEMTIGNSGAIITETLAIINNSSRNKYSNSLFRNNINSVLKINAKSVIIKNNALNSTGHGVHLIYNEGTTDIGIEATEKTLFNKNIVNGNGITSSLIYNHDNSIINFTGNSIDVTNNIIFPAFTFHGNHRDKYSVVFNNKGTINLYLNGNNPSFILANNVIAEGSNGRDIIGFLMEDNSQVIFTNNSNTIATFVLGHDIRSNDNSHSILTFKNSNGYNGSFLIRPKINTIEVNNINIEANTTFYAGVFCDRITRLIGTGDNSNLFVTNDKILTVDIDENNLNDIIFNKPYIIASRFDFMPTEDRFNLISKTIKYNGEDIDVTINYNNENENEKPIITALFTRKKNLPLYEQDSNNNIEKLEEDKTDNSNLYKKRVGTVSKKIDGTAIVPSSTNIKTDKNSNNNEEDESLLPIADTLRSYKYTNNLPILSYILKDRGLSSTLD